MPRTRHDVARDAKVDEIVEAARARLLDGGAAHLSVAAIARELGLAQAAVYWYFPTRDHLFVAAVERILHDVLARKPRAGTTLDHVLWIADRLDEVQDLRMALRERAKASELVAAFDRDVHALLRVLLVNALPPGVDDDGVDAFMALCEGVLLQHLGRRRRREVLRLGYERLVG